MPNAEELSGRYHVCEVVDSIHFSPAKPGQVFGEHPEVEGDREYLPGLRANLPDKVIGIWDTEERCWIH